MGSRTKRCCTSCCGLLTFLAGLAYLLLKLALFILCFTPSVPRQTLTCRDASEMTFFTVIDVFQITLLLTSGCLGMLTCTHRAKMDSILVGYFVLSSIAFFTSSISLVQSSVELFQLCGNDLDQPKEEQGDVINNENLLSPLIVSSAFMTASVCGFISSLASILLGCKDICCMSKVDILRREVWPSP